MHVGKRLGNFSGKKIGTESWWSVEADSISAQNSIQRAGSVASELAAGRANMYVCIYGLRAKRITHLTYAGWLYVRGKQQGEERRVFCQIRSRHVRAAI
ncbi:hypothetical protein F5Y13DRAFT_149289 [Hypoxylon sp. FL1857]|nr:hypothetical protein F5Y13DRAFT_149289 [Hypoxylon sp. FL1857]